MPSNNSKIKNSPYLWALKQNRIEQYGRAPRDKKVFWPCPGALAEENYQMVMRVKRFERRKAKGAMARKRIKIRRQRMKEALYFHMYGGEPRTFSGQEIGRLHRTRRVGMSEVLTMPYNQYRKD